MSLSTTRPKRAAFTMTKKPFWSLTSHSTKSSSWNGRGSIVFDWCCPFMFVAEITDRFADGGSKLVSMMSTFVAPETESFHPNAVLVLHIPRTKHSVVIAGSPLNERSVTVTLTFRSGSDALAFADARCWIEITGCCSRFRGFRALGDWSNSPCPVVAVFPSWATYVAVICGSRASGPGAGESVFTCWTGEMKAYKQVLCRLCRLPFFVLAS